MQEDMGMKWKNSPKAAAFIGMLGALSTILMMVSIPLPFAPGFLRFDVAELPALFAGFFIGPLGGCAVIVVKIVLMVLMLIRRSIFLHLFLKSVVSFGLSRK